MAHMRGFACVVVALVVSCGLAGCGLLAPLFGLDPGLWTDSGTPPTDAGAIDSVSFDASVSDAAAAELPAIDRPGTDRQASEGGQVEAATSDGADAPDAGTIDAAQPSRCGHTSALRDDFTGGAAMFWRPRADFGASNTFSNGSYRAAVGDSAAGNFSHASLTSRFTANIAEDSIAVEVSNATLPANGVEVYLVFWGDSRNWLSLSHYGGALHTMVTIDSASTLWSQAYNAAADRWWKIEARAGQIVFATSPDGTDWNVLHTEAGVPAALGQIVIGIQAYQNGVGPGSVTFDNLDAEPGRAAEGWCPAATLSGDLAAGPGFVWEDWAVGNCNLAWQTAQVVATTQLWPNSSCGMGTSTAFSLAQSWTSMELQGARDDPHTSSWLVVDASDFKVTLGFVNGRTAATIQSANGNDLWSASRAGDDDRQLRIALAGRTLSFETRANATTGWTPFAATTTALHLDQVQIGAQVVVESGNTGASVSTAFSNLNQP